MTEGQKKNLDHQEKGDIIEHVGENRILMGSSLSDAKIFLSYHMSGEIPMPQSHPPEERADILREYFVGKTPLSEICAKHHTRPNTVRTALT